MAAAKSLNTISKLLGVTGETSDAVSAYTRVTTAEAPRLLQMVLKFGSGGSGFLHDKDQTVGIILMILWYFFNGIYLVTHQPAFFGERQNEEAIFEKGWEKGTNMGMPLSAQELRLFLTIHVDDTKMVGKKQNMGSVRKQKEADFEDPTS